jgi:hypothetical protein
MAITELEARLARLETEVEALKQERAGVVPDKKPWWEQISGVFKDSPEFEEAVRLGREWRESQRMEYDEEDTKVTEDANGSA